MIAMRHSQCGTVERSALARDGTYDLGGDRNRYGEGITSGFIGIKGLYLG
jgi:hypothetical protein